MSSSGYTLGLHWRRFIVDVLIGAAMSAVALAAIEDTAGTTPILLLLASALVGAGLLIEPDVTAQSASDASPQRLRFPAEPKPLGQPQRAGSFDTVIADAATV
jgi:hypothetical protein